MLSRRAKNFNTRMTPRAEGQTQRTGLMQTKKKMVKRFGGVTCDAGALCRKAEQNTSLSKLKRRRRPTVLLWRKKKSLRSRMLTAAALLAYT